MSEKIEQFRAEFENEIQSFENSFANAGERIREEKQEQADAIQLIVDQTKTKLAELRSKADASAAELRSKIELAQQDAKINIDEHVAELKQRYNEQKTEVERFWSNAISDLTGGTLF